MSARSAHVVRRRGAGVVRMVNTEVKSSGTSVVSTGQSKIGLVGLAVMGQNLALNVADKGFPISVYNRTASKTDDAVERAQKELADPSMFRGYHDLKEFVLSIERPRSVIMLVKAGKPVDATIDALIPLMEEGDLIIDGGNEWHENTTRRAIAAEEKGILYMGMGVSGGEEGARNGPSLMPGGSQEAYQMVESVLKKVAAQVRPLTLLRSPSRFRWDRDTQHFALPRKTGETSQCSKLAVPVAMSKRQCDGPDPTWRLNRLVLSIRCAG